MITQWQSGSIQRVAVRDIAKNGMISYETDSFKGEILNHAVITGGPDIEIIANVKGGKFKRILVRS